MAADIMQHADKKLRKRAEKNIKKRNEEISGFFWHLVLYVPINYWLLTDGVGWDIWMTLLWGIFLVLHAFDTHNKVNHKARDRRERAIQEEMARIRNAVLSPDKGKRKVKLGDDGEFVEVEEPDEFGQDDRRQQSQNLLST
jgi:2TM domain